jgi:hypothetical protein
MSHIFLVVKGDHHVAEREASTRKVTLLTIKESDRYTETYCTAPMEDKDKIISWYCNAPSYGTTFPCAIGDCLWYNERA